VLKIRSAECWEERKVQRLGSWQEISLVGALSGLNVGHGKQGFSKEGNQLCSVKNKTPTVLIGTAWWLTKQERRETEQKKWPDRRLAGAELFGASILAGATNVGVLILSGA